MNVWDSIKLKGIENKFDKEKLGINHTDKPIYSQNIVKLKICPNCKKASTYYEKIQKYYCFNCNIFIEK